MSGDAPFDLEPPRRSRTLRSTRRMDRPPSQAPAARAADGPAWLQWLAAPALYLGLGFVFAAGLLACLYNPAWGALEARWPHEVFALEDGLFVFGPEDAHVTAFLVAALACLVAACMRPGPARGGLAVVGAAALLVPYAPQAAGEPWQPAWWPTLAMAAVGGALLARHGGQVEGRRRLLLGLGVAGLAAALFFPTGGTGYASAGLDHLRAMGDGTDLTEILATLPQGVGILLLATGVLALLGLGGAWVRLAGGFLLLLLALAVPLDAYLSADGTWSDRLSGLAAAHAQGAWVWLLPLSAGLAETMRPRRG